MHGFKRLTIADSQVECTKGVSASNLTGDEEIILSQLCSTLSDSSSPSSQRVDCDLSCLIDTNAVEIESLEGETCELDEPLQDMGLPFFETILHGSELGELTHPIGMYTEGFKISVLIKVGSFASIRGHFGSRILKHCAIFEIERGEHTRRVPRIVDLN